MSKIISPTPIDIVIRYNELTGFTEFRPLTRPIPFPILVKIFCQVLNILADQFVEPPPGAGLPPAAGA